MISGFSSVNVGIGKGETRRVGATIPSVINASASPNKISKSALKYLVNKGALEAIPLLPTAKSGLISFIHNIH
jgi:hypothetical protein